MFLCNLELASTQLLLLHPWASMSYIMFYYEQNVLLRIVWHMLWLQQLPSAFFGLHEYIVACVHTHTHMCVYRYVFISNYEMTQWKFPILQVFISFPSFSTALQLSTLSVCSKEQDNSSLWLFSKVSQAGFNIQYVCCKSCLNVSARSGQWSADLRQWYLEWESV